MSYLEKLAARTQQQKTFVCVGLDVDLDKLPAQFKTDSDPLFAFNKYIIDQTKDFTAAYKPNMAFYEMYGIKGLQSLYKTIEYIPKNIPVILDAKRGDIGNTSKAYAKAAFEDFQADAITLSPYMGVDSVSPFLEYADKFAYILCLTSNKGSADLQKPDLYKKVASKINDWNAQYKNCGAVVGATNDTEIAELRAIMATGQFLIPGVGAQGGDLEKTVRRAATATKDGFLINSSRGIIYAENPASEAEKLMREINKVLG
jgi:orotidine 5'-phosphate decarboxylase subfamily 2